MDIVNLETLGNGVMSELFEDSLRRVAENIADENTPAKTLREISLIVKFKPNDTREQVAIEVHPKVKLAPVKPFETGIYLATDGTRVKVYQPELPNQPELIPHEIQFNKEING